MLYVLLTVSDTYFNPKLVVNMFGEMLGRIDTAVLSSSASEAEHEMSKATLYVSCHMLVGKGIYVGKEFKYLAIVLKKAYHRLVEAGEFLVRFISSWVVC